MKEVRNKYICKQTNKKIPFSSRLLSTECEGLNLAVFIKVYQGTWPSVIESVDFTLIYTSLYCSDVMPTN